MFVEVVLKEFKIQKRLHKFFEAFPIRISRTNLAGDVKVLNPNLQAKMQSNLLLDYRGLPYTCASFVVSAKCKESHPISKANEMAS